jgi:hypothetical protein
MENGAVESKCAMADNSAPKTRVLKVSETGDFYHKHTCPYLRLMGVWLIKAGILANRHVQIDNPSPGMLVIRLIDEQAH